MEMPLEPTGRSLSMNHVGMVIPSKSARD